MMNTYRIPHEGLTQQAYYDYIGSLPWVFTGTPGFTIDPADELVTVDGTITGFDVVVLPTTPVAPLIISKNDFMDRFTNTELATMLTSANPVVLIVLKRFDATTEIDLHSARVIAAAGALEQLGIIAAGRAAQILA